MLGPNEVDSVVPPPNAFSVKLAYAFAAAHGLAEAATTIRRTPITWQRSYTTSVRKGQLVRLFERQGVWGAFQATCWPTGSTGPGHKEYQRLRRIVDQYDRAAAEQHPVRPVSDAVYAEALRQYQAYIHKQAWVCARKLPRATIYTHEDLVSEAQEQLVRCAVKFQTGRGVRFITYFGVALGHRYGKLLAREWARRGGPDGMDPAPPKALDRVTVPPEQEAWALLTTCPREELRDALRGQTVRFPDRYRRLRRARLVQS